MADEGKLCMCMACTEAYPYPYSLIGQVWRTLQGEECHILAGMCIYQGVVSVSEILRKNAANKELSWL